MTTNKTECKQKRVYFEYNGIEMSELQDDDS